MCNKMCNMNKDRNILLASTHNVLQLCYHNTPPPPQKKKKKKNDDDETW